jgi:hypothetical protein
MRRMRGYESIAYLAPTYQKTNIINQWEINEKVMFRK